MNKETARYDPCDSGIPFFYHMARLDNYEAESKAEEKALHVCRQFVERFDDPGRKGASLIIAGRSGQGKTYLACAMLGTLAEAGKKVKYAMAVDIVYACKQACGFKHFRAICDQYMRADLLVIDVEPFQLSGYGEMGLLLKIVFGRYFRRQSTVIVAAKQGGLKNLPAGFWVAMVDWMLFFSRGFRR